LSWKIGVRDNVLIFGEFDLTGLPDFGRSFHFSDLFERLQLINFSLDHFLDHFAEYPVLRAYFS
jgi:hypothetical protein